MVQQFSTDILKQTIAKIEESRSDVEKLNGGTTFILNKMVRTNPRIIR